MARAHILEITNLMHCISVIRLAFSPRSSGFPPRLRIVIHGTLEKVPYETCV